MLEKIPNIVVQDVKWAKFGAMFSKKEGHKWNYKKDIREIGDAYCFGGIERSTKLILAYQSREA
jgi:hypothetical protein